MEKQKLFFTGNSGSLVERLPVPVYFENKNWRFLSTIIWSGIQTIGLVMLMVFAGGMLPYFMDGSNLISLLRHFLVLALPAVPMLVIFANGSLDLSVGAVAGLTGIIAGSLWAAGNPVAGVFLGLFIAVCIGAAAGFSTGWLKIPGIIVTLIASMAIQPLASVITDGMKISLLEFRIDFEWLGWVIFIPLIVLAFLWMQVPAWNAGKKTVTEQPGETKFGHMLRIGIPYIFSSLAAGIVGIVWISRLQTAVPRIGTGMELDMILIVVLSGTVIFSRFGNILGMLFAAFAVTIFSDMLVLLNISPFLQPVLKILILLCGIVFLYLYHSIVGRIYRSRIKADQ